MFPGFLSLFFICMDESQAVQGSKIDQEFLLLLDALGIEGSKKAAMLKLPLEQKISMVSAQKSIAKNKTETAESIIEKIQKAIKPFSVAYKIADIENCIDVLNTIRLSFVSLTEKESDLVAAKGLVKEVWQLIVMLSPGEWRREAKTYLSVSETRQNKPIYRVLEPAVRLFKTIIKSPAVVKHIGRKKDIFLSIFEVFPSQHIAVSEVILEISNRCAGIWSDLILEHFLDRKEEEEKHIQCVPMCSIRIKYILDEIYYNLSLGNVTAEFISSFLSLLIYFYTESPIVGIMLDSVLRMCNVSKILARVKQRMPELGGLIDSFIQHQEKCRELAEKIDVEKEKDTKMLVETKADLKAIINVLSVLHKINSSRIYDVLQYIRACVLEQAAFKNKDTKILEAEKQLREKKEKQIQSIHICSSCMNKNETEKPVSEKEKEIVAKVNINTEENILKTDKEVKKPEPPKISFRPPPPAPKKISKSPSVVPAVPPTIPSPPKIPIKTPPKPPTTIKTPSKPNIKPPQSLFKISPPPPFGFSRKDKEIEIKQKETNSDTHINVSSLPKKEIEKTPRALYMEKATILCPENVQHVSFDIHLRKPEKECLWSKMDTQELLIFTKEDFLPFAREKSTADHEKVQVQVEMQSLFGQKKSKAIDIVLARIKIPLTELVAGVDALDERLFTETLISGLLANYPTDEELELVRAYPATLVPEIFFKAALNVKNFKDKLFVLHLLLTSCNIENVLVPSIKKICNACRILRENEKIHRVLRITLSVINVLSAKSKNKGAWGIKIESLARVMQDKKIFSLITKKVQEEKIDIDLSPDVQILEEAMLISFDMIDDEVAEFERKRKHIKQAQLTEIETLRIAKTLKQLDILNECAETWRVSVNETKNFLNEKDTGYAFFYTLSRYIIAITKQKCKKSK